MRAPPKVSHSAIPGQPAVWQPVPAAAMAAALARLGALSRTLGRRSIWACACADPISAHWWEEASELHVTVNDAEAWINSARSSARSITWRWGIVRWWTDDWYDPGWHPSVDFSGLSAEWGQMIRRALEWP